jgi:hypothetical protein
MPATVALTTELNALSAKVTTLATQLATLQTTVTGLAAQLGVDEQALAKLVAAQPPPVVLPPPPPPAPDLVFRSDWPVQGIGVPGPFGASGPPKDTWDTYDEFNGGSGVALMSVVPGGPAGENALKVLQAGDPPGYAANVRKFTICTPGQDFWTRFYFNTVDTSGAGDHIVTCELYHYQNLTYLRKMGGPTSFQPIMSLFMDEAHYLYPIGHWMLKDRLANGRWWRFEHWVHWTDGTHIQVHPRIYDDTGALLYQDADYQQSDFGQSANLSWNGRSDWTLASYYAIPRQADGRGQDFQVTPQYLTEFGLGNNGQQGATATGLSWSFARVAVSTTGWVGA